MIAAKPKLSSPLKLPCGVVLQNRFAKASLSEQMANDEGGPGEKLLKLWDRWSASGAGLLLTGNVMVDGSRVIESGNIVIEDDRHMDLMKTWAKISKAGGCAAWIQMNHPGRAQPNSISHQPVAPSPVGIDYGGLFGKPRALTHLEIVDLIHRYAKTAALSKAAGFDGIQIHAAHGHLISQFLSPLSNIREDMWGGDAVRRRRFLLEVVRAVRAAVGPRFPVGVKLNSADFQKGGFTDEESMAVVQCLEAEGIDMLEVSGGNAEEAAMFDEPGHDSESTQRREAFFMDYAEKVRGRTSLPLMVTGGFRSAAGMQHALDSGAVDIIGLGRPMILEPDLPKKILSGEVKAAVPMNLNTGNKKVDALIQFSYYNAQLMRMGAGKSPDLKMSRWGATLQVLGENVWWQTFGNPVEDARLEKRKDFYDDGVNSEVSTDCSSNRGGSRFNGMSRFSFFSGCCTATHVIDDADTVFSPVSSLASDDE